jgi:murein hydrolase activator
MDEKMQPQTVITYLILVICLPAFAQNGQIKSINHNITRLKSTISDAKSHLSSTQKKLAATETKLGKINSSLYATNAKIKNSRTSIQKLEHNLENSKEILNQQKKSLDEQLKHIYYLGRQPALKALLEHSNKDTARFLVYFEKLNVNIKNKISSINTTLKTISNNKSSQQVEYNRLKNLLNNIKSDHTAQSAVLDKRQHLINQLNIVIANKSNQLTAMLDNKRALERTLSQLGKTRQYSGNFKALKGRLQWPLQGTITQSFNAPIYGSQLRTKGVIIGDKSGKSVKAVSAGKVVFARWLAGYGLMIIIDHGNGYMTLYGRNSSLIASVGQKISRGQIIATSGKTGGYKNPGLYFAIRHNGKSLNPARWCG